VYPFCLVRGPGCDPGQPGGYRQGRAIRSTFLLFHQPVCTKLIAKRRKAKTRKPSKQSPKPIPVHEHLLAPMIRDAAKRGMVEAIEHCQNFWSVSDGYKKYIDQQVKSHAEALMAAVKMALRDELTRQRLRKRQSRKQ
jgi:hypothetical protein